MHPHDGVARVGCCYCHDDAVCSCCPCLDHCVDLDDPSADCCDSPSPLPSWVSVEGCESCRALGAGDLERKELGEGTCPEAVEVQGELHIQKQK